jgi:hypothetical protein
MRCNLFRVLINFYLLTNLLRHKSLRGLAVNNCTHIITNLTEKSDGKNGCCVGQDNVAISINFCEAQI